MNRSRLSLLGLCAVIFGVMAMSTSSAQAALSWLVLNSAGTEAKELKALVEGKNETLWLSLLEHVIGLRIELVCMKFTLAGINLEAGGTLTTGGKVRFEECEVWSLKANGELETLLECKPHSSGLPAGTIDTNKGKGALVLHELAGGGKEVLIKIEPEVGTTFATILTEGCALPEANSINGVIYLKDGEGKATVHALEHLIEQGPLTSLFIGKDTAEHLESAIDGSLWLFVSGAHVGLKWAAMDV
jgi:hypothetical protein